MRIKRMAERTHTRWIGESRLGVHSVCQSPSRMSTLFRHSCLTTRALKVAFRPEQACRLKNAALLTRWSHVERLIGNCSAKVSPTVMVRQPGEIRRTMCQGVHLLFVRLAHIAAGHRVFDLSLCECVELTRRLVRVCVESRSRNIADIYRGGD